MRTAHTFIGHKDSVNACKLCFAKKLAITGSLDRSIKFWDLDSGKCTNTVTILYFISLLRKSACRNVLIFAYQHLNLY